MYFNYTGSAKCLNIQDEDDIGADMWSYQACTEMVMPFCYDGSNDMFEKSEWDLAAYTASCQDMWGEAAVPQPDLANSLYGGRDLDSATNIVFSNGLLDPWSSGGVMRSSDTKNGPVSLIIPEVTILLFTFVSHPTSGRSPPGPEGQRPSGPGECGQGEEAGEGLH